MEPLATEGPRFEPRRRHSSADLEDHLSGLVLSSALRRRLSPVGRASETSCSRRPKKAPGSNRGGATIRLNLRIAYRDRCFHMRRNVGSVQSVERREHPAAVGKKKAPGSNPGGATFFLKSRIAYREKWRRLGSNRGPFFLDGCRKFPTLNRLD